MSLYEKMGLLANSRPVSIWRRRYIGNGDSTAVHYQSSHINSVMENDSVQAIYVMNYGNQVAVPYGGFEDFGTIPLGAVLDRYSMSLLGEGGTLGIAPVYSMREVAAGKSPQTHDWMYGVHIPKALSGRLEERDFSFQQEDCLACHVAASEQTNVIFFIWSEFRIC